jgi:hypothetical protein
MGNNSRDTVYMSEWLLIVIAATTTFRVSFGGEKPPIIKKKKVRIIPYMKKHSSAGNDIERVPVLVLSLG